MAHAVVRTVADAVGDRRVTRVTVRVGEASGVVPQALLFAWDVAVTGTTLACARLDVVPVPLLFACRACDARTTPERGKPVRCNGCGGIDLQPVAGRELEVASVEVCDDPEPVEVADDDVLEVAS